MQAILNYLDKYSAQIFVLQMGLLIILTGIILWVYFYNRKKYHNLKHQIPASVVKNYLDSIIQNSTALKSSLFRGGGLDIDSNGVPSVLPVGQMESMGQVGVSLDAIEGDDALKAEVARLQSELSDKKVAMSELEKNIQTLKGDVSTKQERIVELEALLAKQSDSSDTVPGAGDSELTAELTQIKQERDELKEELDQYAMIGDDLADLKRLKQENAQLKSALNPDDLDDLAGELESFGSDTEQAIDAPANEVASKDPEQQESISGGSDDIEESSNSDAPEEVVAASDSATPEEQASDDAPDKSPEDLLSEFEKMLG